MTEVTQFLMIQRETPGLTDKRTAIIRIKTSSREQTVRSRTEMPPMVSQTADKPKRAHLPNRLLHLTQPFNLSSWQTKTKTRLSLEMKINQETTTFLISQKRKNSSAKRQNELSKSKKSSKKKKLLIMKS